MNLRYHTLLFAAGFVIVSGLVWYSAGFDRALPFVSGGLYVLSAVVAYEWFLHDARYP